MGTKADDDDNDDDDDEDDDDENDDNDDDDAILTTLWQVPLKDGGNVAKLPTEGEATNLKGSRVESNR